MYTTLSISANALRSCLRHEGNDVSFESMHKLDKKSTPKQIMLYLISFSLHKILNTDDFPSIFELLTVTDQIICTGRQLRFQIFRNHNSKIGMTANKLSCITNEIGFEMQNLLYEHYKKLVKIQFLEYGRHDVLMNNEIWGSINLPILVVKMLWDCRSFR